MLISPNAEFGDSSSYIGLSALRTDEHVYDVVGGATASNCSDINTVHPEFIALGDHAAELALGSITGVCLALCPHRQIFCFNEFPSERWTRSLHIREDVIFLIQLCISGRTLETTCQR